MGPDFYAILDVAPDADAAQITRAFRQLIRTLHPDTASALHDQAAAERLRQVLAAWRVLHDPDARAAYDRTRRATMPPAQPAPHPRGHPGPTPPADADLVAGPTVIHAGPAQPAGPHIRIRPPIRLDERIGGSQ